jgi:hypothetical protein
VKDNPISSVFMIISFGPEIAECIAKVSFYRSFSSFLVNMDINRRVNVGVTGRCRMIKRTEFVSSYRLVALNIPERLPLYTRTGIYDKNNWGPGNCQCPKS